MSRSLFFLPSRGPGAIVPAYNRPAVRPCIVEPEVHAVMGPDVERRIRQDIEQGIEQGRAEERALLCRMAKRKFGAETAGQLAEILERVARPVDLAEIGEAIIECDTGAVLLDWASRVAQPSP